ncbi:hypothetical protein [Rhodococcus sp. T7]|uniref:hypothetical protein n=1 Tax=Rhodococcus sp. T7 TaxID=627444 RepID=UPI001359FE98|nr:hypothetical protein [Rhodococcus sp. T7]KAF0956885.1 hypothetical protein MLGJGCBP_09965 [Rhodococcus sp. T7]KAF0958653.1 hypothetical protein MLGJGCBP_08225 [Rhodococcus sp. T7]
MTLGMRRILLIELAFAAVIGVVVALLWPGGGGGAITPTSPTDLGPGWLAGLIAGVICLAVTMIIAFVRRRGGELDAPDPVEPDLDRLAKAAVEDDARDRSIGGAGSPAARQPRTSAAGYVPASIYYTDGGTSGTDGGAGGAGGDSGSSS